MNQRFTYLRPTSIPEAVTMLQDKGPKAKVLAGGTDLLVQMRRDVINPNYLISLTNLPLNFIEKVDNGIRIGSITTISCLARSELLEKNFKALWEAAHMIGSVQVRNRGTLGGNLCNGAPSADTAPPLLVMEASIEAVSVKGTRNISINNFFVGPGQTALASNELVTSIFIPFSDPSASTVYIKFQRTTEDIALVGVAVLLEVKREGTVRDLKVAVGAVAPTPIRAYGAEAIGRGSQVNDLDIEKICEEVVSEARPIDDVRSSAFYRRTLVRVLTKRAIFLAMEHNPLVGGHTGGR